MISISAAERRARIATRQHLAPEYRVDSMAEAARGVVGLHATDPASVYLSAWARMRQPSIDAIERELYEERLLIRILAMRRTLFVVPTDDAPILQAAASLGVARIERRRNEQLAGLLGVDDPDGFMRAAEAATLAALEERGEATAQELARAVPALARKVRVNIGKRYEGDIGISSRVLILLALEGRVVRGRPLGTWLSSQYRWATTERWLGRPLPVLDEAEAQAQLVARWLAQFGPGTEADMRWWSGLTARAVRAALAAVGAETVDLDGAVGYILPGDAGGHAGPATVGGPGAGARPHHDGLAGPRLVPGSTPERPLRLEWQRRTDHLGRRPHRGWLDQQRRRRGGHRPARGRGTRGPASHRGRGGPSRRLAGPGPGDAALSHALPPFARMRLADVPPTLTGYPSSPSPSASGTGSRRSGPSLRTLLTRVEMGYMPSTSSGGGASSDCR